MADTKTADQWKQVASQITAKNNEIDGQIDILRQQNIQILQQRQSLESQIANATSGSEERRALIAQYNNLADQRNKNQSAITDLAAQFSVNERAITSANNQAEIAQDSPRGTLANPTTASNTPPANPEPGNNTDVATSNDTPFALANADPQTVSEPLNIREQEAFLAANIDPPEVQVDEFGDLDGAIELQKRIALNTEGQPVLAEDGSVAQGVAINPETGEVYYTDEASDGTSAGVNEARNSGAIPREVPFPNSPDWRVRISLAPGADYLYKDPSLSQLDILYPLKATNGVIYPYTPTITVAYVANYDQVDLAHTNYKSWNYKNSSVEAVQIVGDFTAQDTNEANYLLAVIHFFKCVTKMFYGRDQTPIRGVPPPLVYLSGHGQYGFDNHPMVVTNFTLTYPTDVDYINAGQQLGRPPTLTPYKPPNISRSNSALRLYGAKLQPGGAAVPPNTNPQQTSSSVTRVPTKMQITITANPIITRYDISNNFSLKEYATGKLLRGSVRQQGGGIW